MANNKLFVGNLDWGLTDQDFKAIFEPFGAIVEAVIVRDKYNNDRSRGFGFVTFENEEDAAKAVKDLNGTEVNGREINVAVAEDKPRGERRDGGDRGGYGRRDSY